jgi:hypothetical protein
MSIRLRRCLFAAGAALCLCSPPLFAQVTKVPLQDVVNVYARFVDHTLPTHGGIDGAGNAYSAELLTDSVAWSGATFHIHLPNIKSAVTSATIPLPQGKYLSLSLLGTGVNGAQADQTFTVTYTDNSTQTFTQSLSDWRAPQNNRGEAIAQSMSYSLNSAGKHDAAPVYLYEYNFTLNSAKTVASVTLPDNANVVVAAIDLAQQVPVTLAPTIYAIATDGLPIGNGGLDGFNDAYSATLIGTSVTSGGITYPLGAPGTPSAVGPGAVVTLPAGQYGTLSFVGAGYNGNQSNMQFVVTYTDTTTTTITQSMSDWAGPASNPGEFIASTMAYRDTGPGNEQNGPYFLYRYTFVLDSTRTVQSLTLPSTVQSGPNANIAILAIALTPAISNPPPPPTPIDLSIPLPYLCQEQQPPNCAYTPDINPAYSAGEFFGTGGLNGVCETPPMCPPNEALAANLLGNSLTMNTPGTYTGSTTFTFGKPGAEYGVTYEYIPLPALNYSFLNFLATSINGGVPAPATFTVYYNDGTTQTYTQSFSDWQTPNTPLFPGETLALEMPYFVYGDGTISQDTPAYLYEYSFALNQAKTLQAIEMPEATGIDFNIVILAITLTD